MELKIILLATTALEFLPPKKRKEFRKAILRLFRVIRGLYPDDADFQ